MVISSRYILFFKLGSKYLIYVVILTELKQPQPPIFMLLGINDNILWFEVIILGRSLEESDIEVVKNLTCDSESSGIFFTMLLESESDGSTQLHIWNVMEACWLS